MMEFIIIALAIVIYHRLRPLWERRGDTLGDVLGEATQYDECPGCRQTDCQTATGRGEVITRGGFYVVRQYHVCLQCGIKGLWHRRLDQFVWTIRRSGMV